MIKLDPSTCIIRCLRLMVDWTVIFNWDEIIIITVLKRGCLSRSDFCYTYNTMKILFRQHMLEENQKALLYYIMTISIFFTNSTRK
jgi:hypothetical protein